MAERRGLADDGLAGWIESLRADPAPPASAVGAAGLRQASEQRSAGRPRGPEMARVQSFTVAGSPAVPVRFYQPSGAQRPLVVYVHGGGWTIGDLESHDRICRRLASSAGVGVLALDFRRAPEHPWPAAVDDAVTVVQWAFEHARELVGTDVVAVAGDSSGGNIATLTCLRLRDAGARLPAAQLLAYPNTDLTFGQPSVTENATGWGLEAADAVWFAEQWVPDPARRADPRVSPLLEPDLRGLPPAVVVTAEFDPLRDEGDAYATRLAEAGASVVHRREAGFVHGFLNLDLLSPAAADAGERFFADVRQMLARPSGG